MNKEVIRIARLLTGLADHVEQVAEEYSNALGKHGKPFEDALVDKGFERAWLRCVAGIGAGLIHPRVIFLAPEKREVLSLLPVGDQKKVVENGVYGHPLDEVSVDDLRKAVLKKTDRIPRAAKKKKGKPDSKKWKATAEGITHYRSKLKWAEEVGLISHAIDMGFLTVDQMEQIHTQIGKRLGIVSVA